MALPLENTQRRFQFVLIKPSHYDDDGYVIRWARSIIPANSLAAVYGLARECAERQVLGPDVAIDIVALDETNTFIDIPKLIRDMRRHGGFGLVGLIGVQSNQYPRALDIARPFREAGLQVMMGGFHVSGCLSMLDGKGGDLHLATEMGVSMFAGEAEGRLDEVLRDAAAGQVKPLYNFMSDLPAINGTPTPFLPRDVVTRTLGLSTSFDAGRGCPYQCSFCTIINVQGRKSRFRTPDDLEAIVRENWKQGISRYFITDDNFARNREWEPLFDRLIKLREEDGIPLGLLIQVDTLCHKIKNFMEKAKRAGVTRVFIGLENINPDNLVTAKKKQNKITEYRKMLLAWKAQGIMTLAGYILGFPADTPESVRRDLDIIKRELPVDILEFFCLTPLPGSEDHQKLWRAGTDMDADLNKYDIEHVCTDHPRMSREEWQKLYNDVWAFYYTPEHIETILRRGAASGLPMTSLVKLLVNFSCAVRVEGVHPLQTGFVRLNRPSERRPGLPQESAWTFYPRLVWDTVRKQAEVVRVSIKLMRLAGRIKKDPNARLYTDVALTPVNDDVDAGLDLLTKTTGAASAIAHEKKVQELTHAH